MELLQVLRRVYTLYYPFRKAILLVFLLTMILQGCQLLFPVAFGIILDAITRKENFQKVFIWVGVWLALQLAQAFVSLIKEQYELHKLDLNIFKALSTITLKKFFAYSIGQHKNHHSGVDQEIIESGKGSVISLADLILYTLLPLTLQIVMTTMALFYLDWIIALVSLISLIIYAGSSVLINRVMNEPLQKERKMRSDESKLHTEILRHVSLVQLNGQERRILDEYENCVTNRVNHSISTWSRFNWLSTYRALIPIINRCLVLLLGAWFVYQDKYSIGYLIMIQSWSSNAIGQLNSFGRTHGLLLKYLSSVKRYFNIMEVDPEVKDARDALRPDIKGSITFQKVRFSYPDRHFVEVENDMVETSSPTPRVVLDEIDFQIEAGEKVAIVGHSGAGKSTIISLLQRAYDPEQGAILVDGYDLRTLDSRHYRRSIGFVEQSVRLFSSSLKENIIFGLNGNRDQISLERLTEVARVSNIIQFLPMLENGFDTLIGEGGVWLSGGQCQRVAIARALIKEPSILVFDEATSNLDAENEALIHQAIERASVGRTTIIIAHRLSTIRNSDKIIVMEKGKVVGCGKHDELYAQCKAYRNLIEHQMTM